MKINYILPSPGASGGLKVIYKYASSFSERDNDVKLYFPLWPYCLNRKEKFFKRLFRQIRIFLSNIYHYKFKNKLEEYSSLNMIPVLTISNKTISDADIVIATAWPTAFSVEKLDKSKGKKFYFVQDYEIWDDEEYGKLSYELPLKKIVIADWIKEEIRKQGVEEKIDTVHNGLELNKFENENKIYCNNEHVNCLMLSHHLEKKGVQYGIKAFEIAQKKYPSMKLSMFGLRKLDSIPSYANFILNPTEEELRSLYATADIFIYPSLVEGWGLTVVEAMAAKCAIVGTKTGCLLDLGVNRRTAMISEPGNAEEMGENIIELVENKELLKNIGFGGYNMVKELSWESAVEKFENILKKAQ